MQTRTDTHKPHSAYVCVGTNGRKCTEFTRRENPLTEPHTLPPGCRIGTEMGVQTPQSSWAQSRAVVLDPHLSISHVLTL